jgi:hypothetical protein
MTVTVRPARENHQLFSGLWKFEQGQLSQPEVLGAILPQLANPQPDGIFAKDN